MSVSAVISLLLGSLAPGAWHLALESVHITDQTQWKPHALASQVCKGSRCLMAI